MKFDMPVFLRTYVGTELKSVFAREIGNCQADIRNPLRCLLITNNCSAVYQKELALLLIQASPTHCLLLSQLKLGLT